MAARGVVRTFQKTNILKNLTVFENVLAARHRLGVRSLWQILVPGRRCASSERRLRDEAAEIVDLVGLSARLNTPSASLSCGELRLLEVAIALGAGPRLLMLDEPAAGLNTEEALVLGKALRGLVGTKIEALLLVEHNMSLVMAVSDRVVVMNFGREADGRQAGRGAPESGSRRSLSRQERGMTASQNPILSLRNVRVAYGKAQALHDVSLDVAEGEVAALIGANGAGKTTTLRDDLAAC